MESWYQSIIRHRASALRGIIEILDQAAHEAWKVFIMIFFREKIY